MRLVEQHIIKPSHKYYDEILELCHLSKNLYNATLYEIRQYYFENKKYLSYFNIDHKFRNESNLDYRALPAQTAQQTMKIVDSNFKSFFKLIKKKDIKNIHIPNYLDKEGYFAVIYTNQTLGKGLLSGTIKIPRTNILFRTKKRNIKQVRFIPRCNYIVMEVVYESKCSDRKSDNGYYMGIDLGINNLAAVVSNKTRSFIINGRPVKSINQFYNKRKSELQSKLKNKKTSNRIKRLSFKRNNKVKDYFHKASSYIVNQAASESINTIIIGWNKDWKQDTDMGKKGNQSFTFIPHAMLVNMIAYKGELKGINVVIREESYTSKASFLDKDPIPNLKDNPISFSGKRIKRGLYRTKCGSMINADVNGAGNIMRKEVGDVSIPADRGLVFSPLKINF